MELVAEEEARSETLYADHRRATVAMWKVAADWWRVPGVVGVNVGYRTKFNQIVSPLQIAILVDVVAKQPSSYLAAKGKFTFPREVAGVPVKVRQTRYLSSLATGVSVTEGVAPTTASGRLIGGMAISSTETFDSWGTLGICLPDTPDHNTGNLVAVSNQHVVGASGTVSTVSCTSTAGESQTVASPNPPPLVSTAACVPPGTSAIVGAVYQSALNRFVDASVFSAYGNGLIPQFVEGLLDTSFIDGPLRFLRQSELKPAGRIHDIQKLGARTGAQPGIITNRRMSIRVPELLDEPFENVIEISGLDDEIVTDAGDSGAVMIGRYLDTPVVFGLNFAMSDDRKRCYAFPFGKVLAALGLRLPPHRIIEIP
ncbi:MAG: hypothetical protein RIS70_4355 [Planctomycetota bacterium]